MSRLREPPLKDFSKTWKSLEEKGDLMKKYEDPIKLADRIKGNLTKEWLKRRHKS